MQGIKVVNEVSGQRKQKALQTLEMLESSSRPDQLSLQLFYNLEERTVLRTAFDSQSIRFMSVLAQKYLRLKSINCKSLPQDMKIFSKYFTQRQQLKREVSSGYYIHNQGKQLISQVRENCWMIILFTIIFLLIYTMVVVAVLVMNYQRIKLCHIHEGFLWQAQQVRHDHMLITKSFILELIETCISKQVKITENKLYKEPNQLDIVLFLYTLVTCVISCTLFHSRKVSKYAAVNIFGIDDPLKQRLYNRYGPLNLVFSSYSINKDSILKRDIGYFRFQYG